MSRFRSFCTFEEISPSCYLLKWRCYIIIIQLFSFRVKDTLQTRVLSKARLRRSWFSRNKRLSKPTFPIFQDHRKLSVFSPVRPNWSGQTFAAHRGHLEDTKLTTVKRAIKSSATIKFPHQDDAKIKPDNTWHNFGKTTCLIRSVYILKTSSRSCPTI